MAVEVAGVRWWTTGEAVTQLRVDRKLINKWVQRSVRSGHVAGADPSACPRCQSMPVGGFPHVDPPARRRGVFGYRAQQLLDAEAHTADSVRGGARRRSG